MSLSLGMKSGATKSGCGDWVADDAVDESSVESLSDGEGIEGATVDGEAVSRRLMMELSSAAMIVVDLALTLEARGLA